MAGQLTIDTLKASTGVLATQNGMNGIAKAWVNFNGSTAAIGGSFNVGSVTKNSTGQYTVNLSTSMPNTTYAAVISSAYSGVGNQCINNIFSNAASGGVAPTTSAFSCTATNAPGTAYVDPPYICVSVFA